MVFLIKEWESCGMGELWYFLLRNGGAVVFLVKEWRSCGISY